MKRLRLRHCLVGVFAFFLLVCLGSVGIFADSNDRRLKAFVLEADEASIGEIKPIYWADPLFESELSVFSEGNPTFHHVNEDFRILKLDYSDSPSVKNVSFTYYLSVNSLLTFDFEVMSLLLNVEGVDNNAVSKYHVEVELNLPSGEYRKAFSEVMIDSNSWQEILVDTSEIDEIESISVSLYCDESVDLNCVWVGSVHFESAARFSTIDFLDRYLTREFSCSGGELTQKDDGYVYFFPNGRYSYLEGEFEFDNVGREGTRAFILVTLSGEISGGNITMSCSSAQAGETIYADGDSVQLLNGRWVYPFSFSTVEDMFSYCLSFRNPECGDSGICIESVSVVFTDEISQKASGNDSGSNGYVSEIAFNRENGRLTIQGSVSQSVFAERKKDELVVYAIPFTSELPVGDDFSGLKGTELLRSKVFMNFELVLEAKVTSRYIGTHMFYVTIEGEGHEPILLSPPKGVDSPRQTVRENSIVGIEGASAVGTFESNASHVVVDIPFDRLIIDVIKSGAGAKSSEDKILPSDAVKLSAEDGTVVLLDNSVLREILAEISFYNSANLMVYLRLFDNNLDFLEQVSCLSAQDMEIYSAVLKAVFSEDSELMQNAVTGIILGESFAYFPSDFAEGGGYTELSVYEYASKLSSLASVTFSTIHSCIDSAGIGIIIPYSNDGEFNLVVNQMFSLQIAKKGGFPWYVMCAFSFAEEDGINGFRSVLSSCSRMVKDSGLFGNDGSALGNLYFYIPDENDTADDISAEYVAFLEEVQEQNPAAVFLSVRGLLDEKKEQMCRQLKSIRKEDKNSKIESFEPVTMETDKMTGEMYTVWDFSSLYHNDGWVSGGAVAGCGTGRSEVFSSFNEVSTRALRTNVYSVYENTTASAIILRSFNQPVDMTNVDDVVFCFSIAETDETSTVIFVMGNELIRSEYSLSNVEPGVVHTVRCPISEYSGKNRVAYIGVMVYSGENGVLEIESVKLKSDVLSEDDMAALFLPAADDTETGHSVGYYIVGLLGVFTVLAAILIIRRDREEDDEKMGSYSVEKKKSSVFTMDGSDVL